MHTRTPSGVTRWSETLPLYVKYQGSKIHSESCSEGKVRSTDRPLHDYGCRVGGRYTGKGCPVGSLTFQRRDSPTRTTLVVRFPDPVLPRGDSCRPGRPPGAVKKILDRPFSCLSERRVMTFEDFVLKKEGRGH